jgi:hypothetical protein
MGSKGNGGKKQAADVWGKKGHAPGKIGESGSGGDQIMEVQ